jgi:DNA-directed RNA polymerase specialized sigma24 family protein
MRKEIWNSGWSRTVVRVKVIVQGRAGVFMTQQDWKVEATKLIIEAINTLPQTERDAFVCKHYKGLDVRQIAERMHSSVDETAKILKKAEHRLNQNLNRLNHSIYRPSYAFL